MIALIFVVTIVLAIVGLVRFRQAPMIYWLTGLLFVAAYFWNHYAAQSCANGCDIRVDLLLIVPVLAMALGLSGLAFSKAQR